MTVNSAAFELVRLAAVMRPDWDSDDLRGALAAARNAGWGWPRTFTAVARLLADEAGRPRDLAVAVSDPRRRQPAPAAVTREGTARARAALAAAMRRDELA
jgi:hypothetical protein